VRCTVVPTSEAKRPRMVMVNSDIGILLEDQLHFRPISVSLPEEHTEDESPQKEFPTQGVEST